MRVWATRLSSLASCLLNRASRSTFLSLMMVIFRVVILRNLNVTGRILPKRAASAAVSLRVLPVVFQMKLSGCILEKTLRIFGNLYRHYLLLTRILRKSPSAPCVASFLSNAENRVMAIWEHFSGNWPSLRATVRQSFLIVSRKNALGAIGSMPLVGLLRLNRDFGASASMSSHLSDG